MKLEGKAYSHTGMRTADELMKKYFKESIELIKYWGPVQMCVFYLEYDYKPMNYKIFIECERGFITINVTNHEGKRFSPWMIYPDTNYYHFEDRIDDIEDLVKLTYRAISKNEIVFLNDKEVHELGIEFYDK